MRLKRLLLLLPTLLLLSLFSIASMHSESDNSSVVDSIKINQYFPNHVSLNDSVVNFGKIFLNTPYHYGSPGISSFDCSGFTSHVYRNFGYNLDRSSADQAKQFDSIDRNQLKSGDLVFFSGRHKSKRVGHVGIVVSAKDNGEFEFIHSAVHSGVTISNSNEEYYTKRYLKASRVIGANQMLAISKFITKSEKPKEEALILTPLATPVKTIKKVIPAEYHRVKSGETLSSISKKYGMTIAELKQKNDLKGNKLSLKQSLKVKDEETDMVIQAVQSPINQTSLAENTTTKITEASKDDRDIAANQSGNSHSVKKGESLFSISKLYNMSVDELKDINKIIKEKIHPGQRLKISHPIDLEKNKTLAVVEETPKQTTHKVISGETLFSISKSQNITVEELKRINNLSKGKIHAGQELRINQDREVKMPNLVAEKTQEKKIKNEDKENTFVHKIRKGENLGSIAKSNNMTVDELKRINNLSDSKIHQGQELKLIQNDESKKGKALADKTERKQESKKANSITYKIKKGENLGSIAKANSISVDELKRINNLTDTKIRSGQELKLSQSLEKSKPNRTKGESESNSLQHKVKSGESYYTIAKLYGCTIDDIKDWNRKSGSKIKVGETIIILQKSNKKDLSLLK